MNSLTNGILDITKAVTPDNGVRPGQKIKTERLSCDILFCRIKPTIIDINVKSIYNKTYILCFGGVKWQR